jgi:uncharacterized membrane protein
MTFIILQAASGGNPLIAFVLLIALIILAIILLKKQKKLVKKISNSSPKSTSNSNPFLIILGAILILVGIPILMYNWNNYSIESNNRLFSEADKSFTGLCWGVIMIVIGGILLFLGFPDGAKNKTKIIEKTSVADELLKYKALLEKGAITQEEFEEQKKKLLK